MAVRDDADDASCVAWLIVPRAPRRLGVRARCSVSLLPCDDMSAKKRAGCWWRMARGAAVRAPCWAWLRTSCRRRGVLTGTQIDATSKGRRQIGRRPRPRGCTGAPSPPSRCASRARGSAPQTRRPVSGGRPWRRGPG
ncbi:hypothetical protein C8R44DRAFT_821435 [Mycena epipterygia]|nr:hypothetical protein C8R44DRAFT_821435 [Mycena epipterygia]